MRPVAILFFYLQALLIPFAAHGQVQVENYDLTDVIKSARRDTSDVHKSLDIEVGKSYISVLPVIGYAPANGAVVGGVVSISRLYDPRPTNMSTMLLNLQVTSKKQFIVNVRSKVYLLNNKWFAQGDWRILFFAQPTYGLGINYGTPGSNPFLININGINTNESPLAQDMRFNYVRVYEDIVRHVGNGYWYVGAGLALDYHYNIKDQKLQLDTAQSNFFVTDHYAYSTYEKFSPKEYTTTGFNFNVLNDRRDNIANPYSGSYASFSYRINPKGLSTQSSTMFSYDLRLYQPLSASHPRHVLAFWNWGTFVTSGHVPYLALPSIGWDTYNRSGRGYIQGRFRGTNMVYVECEYRFPLSRNGLFGGVAFLNGTTASSLIYDLAHKLAPGGGVGVRVKMDKRARVNLCADIAYGADNSGGIYLNLQETF